MKYFLIAILVSSFILTGCSQQQGLSQNELFDKQLECSKLYDMIDKRIKNYNQENNMYEIELSEVFYSPKLNKCIYSDIALFREADFTEGTVLGFRRVLDINTYPGINPGDFIGKRFIAYCGIAVEKDGIGRCEYEGILLDQIIQELKGE